MEINIIIFKRSVPWHSFVLIKIGSSQWMVVSLLSWAPINCPNKSGTFQEFAYKLKFLENV